MNTYKKWIGVKSCNLKKTKNLSIWIIIIKKEKFNVWREKKICEWKNRYPYETLENIAKKFEVSKSLVSGGRIDWWPNYRSNKSRDSSWNQWFRRRNSGYF